MTVYVCLNGGFTLDILSSELKFYQKSLDTHNL